MFNKAEKGEEVSETFAAKQAKTNDEIAIKIERSTACALAIRVRVQLCWNKTMSRRVSVARYIQRQERKSGVG